MGAAHDAGAARHAQASRGALAARPRTTGARRAATPHGIVIARSGLPRATARNPTVSVRRVRPAATSALSSRAAVTRKARLVAGLAQERPCRAGCCLAPTGAIWLALSTSLLDRQSRSRAARSPCRSAPAEITRLQKGATRRDRGESASAARGPTRRLRVFRSGEFGPVRLYVAFVTRRAYSG